MGRKPKYENPDQTIQDFFSAVSDSYRHPGSGDEVGDAPGRKKQELLAEEFEISRIKVRKILITTGDIIYPQTQQIQVLMADGLKMPAVAEKMGISISSVNSLLPYSKGVYGLDVSAAADRTAIYRARKEAVEDLHTDPSSVNLWRTICLFQGYPFQTAGRKSKKDGEVGGKTEGKKFRYEVSEPGGAGGRRYEGPEVEGFGNEMFIVQNGERREKSITRSSVDYAFRIATTSTVTGPKQLKIYGSSYVYALFVRFGLIGGEEAGE